MDTLNLLASIATILSFLISLFVLNKVNNIDKSIKIKKNNKVHKQDVKGDNNVTSGRDSNIKK